MADRDDFSVPTKRFVALRAGYRCSFAGCSRLTVGPSEESPTSYTSVGDAAHISGAAPGGPRYLSTLSAEERSSIENAIWLCAIHARAIDGDTSTFTIEALADMKRDHEIAIATELLGIGLQTRRSDLIAIGPDTVCTGDRLEVDGSAWSFRLNHFVSGDMPALVQFIGRFEEMAAGDRYVLLNELGDGRLLSAAPTLTGTDDGYFLRCPVRQSFPRIRAQKLLRDFAIDPVTNDPYAENGRIAEVSGVAALPQKIRSCLSLLPGESPMHPRVGARLAEYFRAFRDSPWLVHLLKLEVIRQAAIPYEDLLLKRSYTLLQCVERVRSVVALSDIPSNGWLPIRVDLDVAGVGQWCCDLKILIERKSPRALGSFTP